MTQPPEKGPNPTCKDLEREARRLERLRLASVVTLPKRVDDEDEPRPAA